jgi:hypothetical protein
MPWFNYNFPNDANLPTSYTLASGTPACTGDTLCAIYTTVATGTIPAQPVLTEQVRTAITNAIEGNITNGVTKLRPA